MVRRFKKKKKTIDYCEAKVDIVNYKIEISSCHCGKLTSNSDHSGVSLEVGKSTFEA